MRVLVTGADGFVGSYLCGALLDDGRELVPHVRDARPDLVVRAADQPLVERVVSQRPHAIALPDDEALTDLFAETRPDVIVHLAALSTIPDSEDLPRLAHDVNVRGTESVVAGILNNALEARLVLVSSCIVHGPTPVEEQPVNEQTATRPTNAYGQTKLQAESVVLDRVAEFAIPPVIVRPFNHFGPGQSSQMVLSSFARQIAEMKRGTREPVLTVGNLDVRREFLDVRDVVDAYRSLLALPEATGIFTIASGRPHRLRDLVDRMAQLAGVDFEIHVDSARLRSNDLEVLYGDASRLHAATGWSPRRSVDESLRDLLSYWSAKIADSTETTA